MDDQNKLDVTDTSVSFNELTNRLKVGDSITLMQQVIEEPDSTGGTVRVQSFAFTKRSWTERLLDWFRRT
jgi:uncharacterized protein YjdB